MTYKYISHAVPIGNSRKLIVCTGNIAHLVEHLYHNTYWCALTEILVHDLK